MTDTPTYDVNFHVHSVGAGSLSGHMNVSFDINGLPDPDYPSAYGANVKGASSVGGQLHTEFGDQNEGVIQKEPRSYEGRETVTRSVSVSEQDYNAIRDAVVGEVGQSYDYALSGLLSDDVPKTCAEFAQSVYAGTSQPGMVGDLFTTLDAITVQGPIWDFIPGFGIHNIYDSLFTTVLMDMLDPPPDTSRPASNGPADVSGITGFAHEEIAVAIGVSPDAPPPAGFNGTVTTLSNGNVVHSRGVYDLEGPESVVNPHDSNNDHSDQPRGGSEGFGGGLLLAAGPRALRAKVLEVGRTPPVLPIAAAGRLLLTPRRMFILLMVRRSQKTVRRLNWTPTTTALSPSCSTLTATASRSPSCPNPRISLMPPAMACRTARPGRGRAMRCCSMTPIT